MYSIAVPKTNDRSWYDKISRAKHNPVKGDLGACRQRVFKAYGDYLATVPDAHFAPAPAPAFAANERDALNDAYTGETKALARMKKRITANGIVQGRCPYCGINEGSDFDHYLPVTHYPQYATFAKNLAPC
ncbi:hypothetical protein G3V82_23825, partial [Escherichia coli]|nr:hypothetical protein [Escherichia coli]